MSMMRRRGGELARLARHAALAVSLVAPAGFAATAMEPPEVHQVEAEPAAYLDQPIALTGRFSAFGAGKLRLVGSRIDFRVMPAAGSLRRAMTHVELKGRLSRIGTGLAFDITEISPLPPEAQRFKQRRAVLRAPQFESLYELSRWARQRGNWYGDERLLELAWTSYREAFRWEEDETARIGDVAKLLALAGRGESLGLEVPEAIRIRHRALWLKAASLPIAQPASRRQLAAEVRQLLPGTDEPLPHDTGGQWVEYEKRPVEIYQGLPETDRRRAHRAFWIWLVAQAFVEEARQPGAGVAELVDEARSALPDRPAIVHQLEKQLWTQRTAHPERMTRSDLERARAAWRRLSDDQRAATLTAAWLAGQLERLTTGDAEARLRLAQDYLELADDRNMAARLAREAAELSPEMGEAASLLERLGYVRIAGQWKQADELSKTTTGENISNVVRPGDSESTVREKLRPPDRVTRVAGRGWIQEQWIYDGPGRFSIYLQRITATGRAVVVRVVGR